MAASGAHCTVRKMKAIPFLQRGQVTAFEARHHKAWEGVMAALAVGYLALAFLADQGSGAFPFLIGALAVIFLTEFFVRLWDSPSRGR